MEYGAPILLYVRGSIRPRKSRPVFVRISSNGKNNANAYLIWKGATGVSIPENEIVFGRRESQMEHQTTLLQ